MGYVLFLISRGLATWAEVVNKFFEVTVRIQSDRGKTVIETGPYAIIRHPEYAAGILISAATALCLGFLCALIPAGVAAILFILRTHWEDQMLYAELFPDLRGMYQGKGSRRKSKFAYAVDEQFSRVLKPDRLDFAGGLSQNLGTERRAPVL